MNFLAQFVSDHPIAATVVGVIVVGRILARDISHANKFIIENEQKPETISVTWDGADRRGPRRAKNVIRPDFSQTVILEEDIALVEKKRSNSK